MAYTVVLSDIPETLTIGDSVSWSWSDSDFPASESWVLTYTLVKSGNQEQITSSADGDDHLVEVAATTTANYTAGEYNWQAHVSNGTERYKVAVGVIEIIADFAEESTGYDARSHYKTVLDALEAAIEGRASKTQLEQKAGEVSVKHMTLEELMQARDMYAAKYQQELVKSGKAKSHRQIKARFTL